jgi:hypothetical protein
VNILGQQIDLLFLLQVSVTVVLLFSYSTLRAIVFTSSAQSSDAQTILLLDFVLGHSKDSQSFKDYLGVEEDVLKEGKASWISLCLQRYQQQDKLPSLDDYGSIADEVKSATWIIVVSPLIAIFFLFYTIMEERKQKVQIINHTGRRKNDSAAAFSLFFACLGYLLLALWVLSKDPGRWVGVLMTVLVALNSIGVVFGLGTLLLLIRQQYLWKSHWQEELFKIMASAKKDHDLFNRCLILRREIASEPDIPIPGAVTTYVVLFSIIQTILVWVSNRVSWF